jgi:hypothetical protein
MSDAKLSFEFDRGIAVCRLVGDYSVDEVEQFWDDMTHDPGFRRGIPILADATASEVSFSTPEIAALAKLVGPVFEGTETRIALVVSQPAYFGLARMFSAHLESKSGVAPQVFYAAEEAFSWLQDEGASAAAAAADPTEA